MEEKGKISQPINMNSLTTLGGDVKPLPTDQRLITLIADSP
jgi:hypothetical protein